MHKFTTPAVRGEHRPGTHGVPAASVPAERAPPPDTAAEALTARLELSS